MVSKKAYLYLSRHNIYYFRVIVPLGVLGSITKHEYRKSLQTRDPTVACKISGAMRAFLEQHYVTGRSELMKWADLKKVLDEKLGQLIAAEHAHIEKKGPYSTATEDYWLHNPIPNYEEAAEEVSQALFEHQKGSDVSLKW